MSNPVTYHDDRAGDVYVAYFDEQGDFLHATRWIERIGGYSISYDRWEDVPPAARHEIENKLCRK